VISRNPLWDEHEEESDPRDERVLDQGRLTLTTHWRDATVQSVARMPEDTLMPLLLALGLTALFCALLIKSLPWAAVFVVASMLVAAGWLWPDKHVKGSSA
jgi:hypothetical protein